MSPLAYTAAGIAAAVLIALAVAIVLLRRRTNVPLTPQQRLDLARRASKQIRRETRRPDRDHYEKGHGVPDRHSAAIGENAITGDFSSGSSL